MLTPTSGARSRPSPQNCWKEVLSDAEHPPGCHRRPIEILQSVHGRPAALTNRIRPLRLRDPRVGVGSVRPALREAREPCLERRLEEQSVENNARLVGRASGGRPVAGRREGRVENDRMACSQRAPRLVVDSTIDLASSAPANRPHRADDLSLRRRTSPCAQRRCAARARPEPARRGATALPRARSCLRPRDRRPRRASAEYSEETQRRDRNNRRPASAPGCAPRPRAARRPPPRPSPVWRRAGSETAAMPQDQPTACGGSGPR